RRSPGTRHDAGGDFGRFQRSGRPSDALTSHGPARLAWARTPRSISPLAIFGDFSARLVRRTASPRTAPPDASRLARHRAFHRSPRRPTRLGSHDTEHFTARLAARRVSARTTILTRRPSGASASADRR